MRKRLEALKKDQKGFTLVELIVVLVILAILAALLVPALLGYIDRARTSKYLEEARSIYTAIQAVQDEKYAKNDPPYSGTVTFIATDSVNNLVTPTKVHQALVTNKTTASGTTYQKTDYVVQSLKLSFESQESTTTKPVYVLIEMTDGEWNTDSVKISTTAQNVSN